jgi:hypothetical protein
MRRAFAAVSGVLSGVQPGRFARIMEDPAGLQNTSLWDDLAALYLLRPDVFGRVRDPSGRSGGHLEPCVPAREVRAILVAAAAGTPLNANR